MKRSRDEEWADCRLQYTSALNGLGSTAGKLRKGGWSVRCSLDRLAVSLRENFDAALLAFETMNALLAASSSDDRIRSESPIFVKRHLALLEGCSDLFSVELIADALPRLRRGLRESPPVATPPDTSLLPSPYADLASRYQNGIADASRGFREQLPVTTGLRRSLEDLTALLQVWDTDPLADETQIAVLRRLIHRHQQLARDILQARTGWCGCETSLALADQVIVATASALDHLQTIPTRR